MGLSATRRRPTLDPNKHTSYSTAEYDTAEEAAAAASSIFNPMSVKYDQEIGGGIIRNPETGKYRFTYTMGTKARGNVQMVIRKKPSEELVAMWHTHGGEGHQRDIFSAHDEKAVQSIGVPFYMANHKGALKILTPKDVDGRRAVGRNSGSDVLRPDGEPYRIRTELDDVLSPRNPVVGTVMN